MDGWGRVQLCWVPCSVYPQPPCCGSAAGPGTLQLGSMAVSRLPDNLRPSMSTTINRLISTDLKKDTLMFTRLIVACPKPWAGASSAGGAGDVLGGECWPHASCAVFLHRKNTFTSDLSCTLTQPQGHMCPYRYCTTSLPETSSLESP